MVYGDNHISVKFEGDHSYNTYTDVLHYISHPGFSRSIDYGSNQTITLDMPNDADGTLFVYYKTLHSQEYSLAKAKVQDGSIVVTLPRLPVGYYELKFDYRDDSRHYTIRQAENQTFEVTPRCYLRFDYSTGLLGVNVSMPNNYSDTVCISYFGKNYDFEVVNGFGSIHIPMYIGHYSLRLILNRGTEDEFIVEFDYEILPIVSVPTKAVRNTDSIEIDVGNGYPGTVAFFVDGKYVRKYAFVKGKTTIPLPLLAKGAHTIKIKISNGEDEFVFVEEYRINVKWPPHIKAASSLTVLYQSGQTYKVKLLDSTGNPYKSQPVQFYVGGKLFKTVKTNSKGIAELKLTQLPGKYMVVAKSGDIQLSKSVTVKQILTLKKVAVKKSAKSLILQVSLAKVNGKFLKNKLITFKFNGITYKAKTDAKGIAKVTVKNSVLKKLKVGKKVTYTATYVKTTLKKTVLVEK